MPKRKNIDEDYDYLEQKLRRLERKLRKKMRGHRSRRRRSPRSFTRSPGSQSRSVSPVNTMVNTDKLNGSEEQDEPIASTSAQAVVDSVLLDAVNLTPECPAQPPSIFLTPAALDSSNLVEPEQEEIIPELDNTILEILGTDPTQCDLFGDEIQKELAIRLEHYACNGLSAESRKELKDKYLVPSNCKLITAPVLNAELKAAVSEALANRDKAIVMEQTRLTSALSALSQALTRLIISNDKDAKLIKILMDTSLMLCDCQYSQSVRRRGLILSSLRKDIKDPLQSLTRIDNYLFGQGLAETLKTAKAVNKSGTELKPMLADKQHMNKKQPANIPKPLNWKGPIRPRRQPEPFRTKEHAATKYRQFNSSKPSQQRPQRNVRRR